MSTDGSPLHAHTTRHLPASLSLLSGCQCWFPRAPSKMPPSHPEALTFLARPLALVPSPLLRSTGRSHTPARQPRGRPHAQPGRAPRTGGEGLVASCCLDGRRICHFMCVCFVWGAGFLVLALVCLEDDHGKKEQPGARRGGGEAVARWANAEKPVNTAPRARAPTLCKRPLQARAPAAGDPSVPPGKPVFSGTCAEMGSRASWRPCGIVETSLGTTELWPGALYHEGSGISAWSQTLLAIECPLTPGCRPGGCCIVCALEGRHGLRAQGPLQA